MNMSIFTQPTEEKRATKLTSTSIVCVCVFNIIYFSMPCSMGAVCISDIAFAALEIDAFE